MRWNITKEKYRLVSRNHKNSVRMAKVQNKLMFVRYPKQQKKKKVLWYARNKRKGKETVGPSRGESVEAVIGESEKQNVLTLCLQLSLEPWLVIAMPLGNKERQLRID